MRFAKPLTYGLALFVAAVAMPVRAADPDVLKQVPPNATLVVVVPDLAGLSDKVSKIAAGLNITDPQFAQPLGMIKSMLGVEKGLNESGGLAVVLPTFVFGADPQPLIILPVSDYKAFVSNFGVADAGAGVSAIEFQGQAMHVKQAGKYAILSPDQALVSGYTAPTNGGLGARPGALGAKIAERSDVMVFVDVAQLAPILAPIAQMALAQGKMQLQGNPQAAQAIAGIDMADRFIQSFLRDGQSLVMGLDVSAEGIGLTYGVQFKEGTPLAGYFPKAPTGELAFDRLPDKPYFFAVSMNPSVLPIEKMAAAVTSSMPENMKAMMQSSVEFWKLAGNQVQAGIYTPAIGAGGGGWVNSVTVITTAEPDKFIAANRKMIEGLNNTEIAPGASIRTEYQENAIQVEGAKRVDLARQKTELPPELAGQAAFLAGFMDTTSYIVPLNKAVLLAAGADPSTLKDIVAAASGGGKLADRGIAAIRPKLLGSRAAEAYIGIGTIAQFANGFLGLMAPQFVVQVPPDLPPVAATLSVDNGGVAASLYVPVPVIQAIKAAVDKIMGGGAPSGPGAGVSAAPVPATSKLVLAVTDSDFDQQVLQAKQPVLVDFFATWSNQCKAQAPIIDALAKQYEGRLKVARIDVDQNTETIDLYEVEDFPSALIFKDGIKIATFPGPTSKEKLDQAIQKALQ